LGVAHPEENAPDKPVEGASRLIVLWLCWVVLAVFLGAVAIVDF